MKHVSKRQEKPAKDTSSMAVPGRKRTARRAAGLRNKPEQLFDYLNCGRTALIKRKTKLKKIH